MWNNEYVCYATDKTIVFNYIDNYFKNKILEFGAEEYHIPAMICESVLEKCGYFQSFPHHLTLASYVNPDNYNRVSNKHSISDEMIVNSKMYFTPAACLHLYPMLENSIINELNLTTNARVYRYENKQFNSSTRLWDFSVRELVFIGNREYVQSMLDRFMDITKEFSDKMTLPVNITSAIDNFYPSKKNKVKEKLQKSNPFKHEALCKISDEDIAIASFNYHGTHFSKAFNFDNNNSVVTGCVGYGLERWVSAFEHYNIDIKETK